MPSLVLVFAGCGDSPATGSLEIRALASPTCPVQMVPPDPACAPQPIAVRVAVLDQDGERVAAITTRVDGPARVTLKRGRYRLVGADPGLPRLEAQEVTVAAAPAAVTLSADTGIR